jgi:hypothetical protein
MDFQTIRPHVFAADASAAMVAQLRTLVALFLK